MKKLLSLLAIAGLVGSVAMPIYAQDVEVTADQEDIVYAVENATLDAEDAALEDVAAVEVEDIDVEDVYNLEASDEEYTMDLWEIESFNDIFENEEVKAALDEAGLTNEEAAWILGGITGLFAGLGVAGIVVAIVFCILVIIAMWKIFTKAWEAGWKSLIPIYNVYIMYKIAGMKNWFWYTFIVAFVLWLVAGFMWEWSDVAGILEAAALVFSGIVAIVATYKLPRKFGWGVFASILYVLFTGICVLILGFGKSKYEGKSEETVVEA